MKYVFTAIETPAWSIMYNHCLDYDPPALFNFIFSTLLGFWFLKYWSMLLSMLWCAVTSYGFLKKYISADSVAPLSNSTVYSECAVKRASKKERERTCVTVRLWWPEHRVWSYQYHYELCSVCTVLAIWKWTHATTPQDRSLSSCVLLCSQLKWRGRTPKLATTSAQTHQRFSF